MSCYLRHLGEILNATGLRLDTGNRERIDRAIHEILEIEYKNCPVTWKKLKQEVLADEKRRLDFTEKLRLKLGPPEL